jgi:hypothetical protein
VVDRLLHENQVLISVVLLQRVADGDDHLAGRPVGADGVEDARVFCGQRRNAPLPDAPR